MEQALDRLCDCRSDRGLYSRAIARATGPDAAGRAPLLVGNWGRYCELTVFAAMLDLAVRWQHVAGTICFAAANMSAVSDYGIWFFRTVTPWPRHMALGSSSTLSSAFGLFGYSRWTSASPCSGQYVRSPEHQPSRPYKDATLFELIKKLLFPYQLLSIDAFATLH
jgi:hypothetical protein